MRSLDMLQSMDLGFELIDPLGQGLYLLPQGTGIPVLRLRRRGKGRPQNTDKHCGDCRPGPDQDIPASHRWIRG